MFANTPNNKNRPSTPLLDKAASKAGKTTANRHRISKEVAMKKYQEHLLEISADPTPTPLSDYMGGNTLQVAKEFTHLATSIGMPNAVDLKLSVNRLSRPGKPVPVWKKIDHTAKSGLFSSLLLNPVWEGRGYEIGNLSLEPAPSVYITGGGLVADRYWVPKSYGHGQGRLPDRDWYDYINRNLMNSAAVDVNPLKFMQPGKLGQTALSKVLISKLPASVYDPVVSGDRELF